MVKRKWLTCSENKYHTLSKIKPVPTWLVSELSLLLSGSSCEATKADSSEVDCVVEGVGVYKEREWRLPVSGSSSSSMPW